LAAGAPEEEAEAAKRGATAVLVVGAPRCGNISITGRARAGDEGAGEEAGAESSVRVEEELGEERLV